MKTFYIFKRGHFDYLSLTVRWPHLDIRYKVPQDYDKDNLYNKFGLYMPSGIHWFNDRDAWNLGVEFLGFGIQITRQWGY